MAKNIDQNKRQPAGTKDPDAMCREVQSARARMMGVTEGKPEGRATEQQRAAIERRGGKL